MDSFVYLKTHLKLLLDKFVKACAKQDKDEIEQTKREIDDTKKLMNEIDIRELKIQIPITEDSCDDLKFN